MSRAAGGTYTLPGGNPTVTGTVISTTWANTTMSDIATALTDSLSRSGLGGMTSPLLGVDGTTALPGYSFTNEPSSGLYRIGAGSIGMSVLNRLGMSWAAAGNVTIAAPSSGTAVTINGIAAQNALNVVAPAAADATIGLVGNAGTPGTTDFIFRQISDGRALIFNRANANLQIGTNGNTTMLTLAAAGNVTIASPTSSFHSINTFTDNRLGVRLTDGINYTGSLGRSTFSANAFWVGAEPGSTLVLGGGGVNALSISTDGHVAIALPTATSTPTLTVNGAAARIGVRVPMADSTGVGVQVIDGGANATELRLTTNNSQARVQSTGVGSTSLALLAGATTCATFLDSGVMNTFAGNAGTHSTKIADSAGNSLNAGYLEVPQNIKNVAYTTVLSDAGKHIYHSDGTARTYTIDSNANVPYPIGTTITFVNDASAAVNVTIGITTDTLYWAADGTTTSRTLARFGTATALKVTATRWSISGTGLS
jgi:hypothetical protein